MGMVLKGHGSRIVVRVGVALGLALALSLSLTLSPPVALAWNEAGHRLVAQLAWEGLSPAQRQFIVALLAAHPRYAEDFEGRMPPAIKALPTANPERGRWLFAQAAAWPDMMKGEAKQLAKAIATEPDAAKKAALEKQLAEVKRFDATSWHFDNKPIYLDPYELAALPAASTAAASATPRPMGVQDALPKSLKDLRDASLAPPTRALALCWVAHLIGDAHQPLHTSAIFSAKHLPQGDLGGNRIEARVKGQPQPAPGAPPVSLHQRWDDLFFDDPKNEVATRRQVAAAFPRARLAKDLPLGDPAAADADVRFTNLLLDESYRVAEVSVYDARLRGALLALPATGAPYPTVILDPAYFRDARTVATRRLALAAYRLADHVIRAAAPAPAPPATAAP